MLISMLDLIWSLFVPLVILFIIFLPIIKLGKKLRKKIPQIKSSQDSVKAKRLSLIWSVTVVVFPLLVITDFIYSLMFVCSTYEYVIATKFILQGIVVLFFMSWLHRKNEYISLNKNNLGVFIYILILIIISGIVSWFLLSMFMYNTCELSVDEDIMVDVPVMNIYKDFLPEEVVGNIFTPPWGEAGYSVIGVDELRISGSFKTGFENILDFENFYITPNNYLGTTQHTLSKKVAKEGYAHKAWITGVNEIITGVNTNHRGYPTIQLHKTQETQGLGVFEGIVYLDFWVWLDTELVSHDDWFSLATLTSYADDEWPRTLLANVGSDNVLRLVHLPRQGEQVHDIFQVKNNPFPMREWVHIGIYVDYTKENKYKYPYAALFQNDVLVSAGTFDPQLDVKTIETAGDMDCLLDWDHENIQQAERLCGLIYTGGLAQAHFGLYAPPKLQYGVIYNDNLAVYELTRD